MSKRRIQFLVISTVAAILIVSPQIFAQPSSPVTPASPTDATSFFNTTFWQNVAVAILSAVLAFLSGYALADELIDNLYNVEFELENTGDTVVKSQEIRFEFPEDTRILDFSFDPEPEPEMGVTKIETGEGLKPHERKCRIGQIERGQKVGFQFAATNKADIQEVKIHPFNEIGDVEFSPREIAKQMSDKEQVTKFLIYSIFYLLIPPVFDSFPVLYGEIMAGVARLLILFNLFKLIAPFSEAIADLITHFSSFALDSEKGRYIDINGKVGESIIVTGDSNTVALYRDEDKGDEPDAA
jgi:hypothetical protein